MNGFMITVSSLFLAFVISRVSAIWTWVGVLVLSAQVLSHFLTFIVNPGIPDRTKTGHPHCSKCGLPRDATKGILHCDFCGVCVEGLRHYRDKQRIGFNHHCPWVGKCIAKNNLVLFYVFTVCTCLLVAYIFVAAAVSS